MPRAFRQCPEWDYVRQAKEELQVPRRAAVGAYAKLSECQDSTKEWPVTRMGGDDLTSSYLRYSPIQTSDCSGFGSRTEEDCSSAEGEPGKGEGASEERLANFHRVSGRLNGVLRPMCCINASAHRTRPHSAAAQWNLQRRN